MFKDERGIVRFVNDFHFEGVKRFYTIFHPDKSIIRAWQGHKKETKVFYVTNGSFTINWIKIDDWTSPSKDLMIESKVLSESESELLIVKPGYANGFKANENNSTLLVFSDMLLEESEKDDYRWGLDYFSFKG